MDFEVIDPDINFSDHLPLQVVINIDCENNQHKVASGSSHNKPIQKQLRWDKADTSTYYNQTGVNLSYLVTSLDDT